MIEYPPYIEGILPAFASAIRIPFQMNPAVSSKQVKYFVIKYMDLNANVIGYDYVAATSSMFTNGIIKFDCGVSGLPRKNFYKIQVAYSDMTLANTQSKVNELTYSTVGVIKRTNSLSGKGTWVNFGAYENNLKFNNFKLKITITDLNEPIYEYRFYIRQQSNNKLFYDTGFVLHNTETDTFNSDITERYSELICTINKIYKKNTQYKTYCSIRTINGYEYTFSSAVFTGVTGNANETITNFLTYSQSADDYEEGRIQLKLKITSNTIGNFMIKRTSSIDNHSTWDNIYTIAKNSAATLSKTIYDYAVEQGVGYKYYLINYNSNGSFVSEYLGSPGTELIADFEYIYIGDKDKQLKLKFDSNVSSFKSVIQEQKVETIGSAYPFFYRNGTIKYKEFPITGLLTYLEDDKELFMSRSSLGINNTNIATTNLVPYNFYAERTFKTAVLDWLNNGQPKLLRTSGEGNYIVRLMGVNLSPKAGTSNLLHSFQATAYEIQEYNYNNLKERGLVKW